MIFVAPPSPLELSFRRKRIKACLLLKEAIKAGNDSMALQLQLRVHHISHYLSLRRAFREKKYTDDNAGTRAILREQIECLRALSALMDATSSEPQIVAPNEEEEEEEEEKP